MKVELRIQTCLKNEEGEIIEGVKSVGIISPIVVRCIEGGECPLKDEKNIDRVTLRICFSNIYFPDWSFINRFKVLIWGKNYFGTVGWYDERDHQISIRYNLLKLYPVDLKPVIMHELLHLRGEKHCKNKGCLFNTPTKPTSTLCVSCQKEYNSILEEINEE